MGSLIVIVEGDGEVEAAPLLLRRILHEHFDRADFTQFKSKNAHGRENLLKPGGLEKYLNYARIDGCDGLVVLLDSEVEHKNCPPGLARSLSQRAKNLGLPFPVVIVCAAAMYEAWFLASIHTLADNFDLPPDTVFDGDVEQVNNPKNWLTNYMTRTSIYKETTHQVSMTAAIDMLAVQKNSRSFRRMLHAVEELLNAIDQDSTIVTPGSEESAE